ncbi:HIRAN domain-containing protein [Chloropicon primus]|uniref:HIRAN domain-containing protein n=1 Tax=Chloropicon primus TaxID=1764295 RepID=A0A5B8MN78_9CHLO|nr:hypothetical protein A3770_06p44910 [Chloropicon primus]UPR01193.1 HIRAN domain-containing protein [Chloropicon primus]|eukprot:QDZ21973.1 hypothetical protein A3770_06p44910 [Chloropicon primus]
MQRCVGKVTMGALRGPGRRWGTRLGWRKTVVPCLCLSPSSSSSSSSSRLSSSLSAGPSPAGKPGDELERTTFNVPRLTAYKPRREMIQAARTLSINVAGVSFEQRQDLVKMMRVGNAVLLEQEPLNRFDPLAVAVYTLSGEKLGYVPRTMTHLLRQQRYALGVVESVGPVALESEGGGLEGPEDNTGLEEMESENLWYLCVTVKPSLPALTIDLVPKSVRRTNMKAELPVEVWDELRTDVYEKAGYRCEVCGDQGDKWPVECQEEYHYDVESLSRHRQTLKGFVALCPACHKVKHAGRCILSGELKLVTQQLMRVNRWTHLESQMYLQKAVSQWQERSLVEWDQDVSVLGPRADLLTPGGKSQEWEGGDPIQSGTQ